MAKGLDFRRRREAMTDYKKRLSLVKGGYDRVVVRKSGRRIIGEIVRYGEKGDMVLAYADSNGLKKYNWPSRSNRPTAYLTGMLLAKTAASKIKEKGNDLVLDIGLSSPVRNSVPFVFAKGFIDGGMKLRSGIELKEEIYNYSNIDYAKKLLSENRENSSKQYGKFIKDGIKVEALGSLFQETKKKIMSS